MSLDEFVPLSVRYGSKDEQRAWADGASWEWVAAMRKRRRALTDPQWQTCPSCAGFPAGKCKTCGGAGTIRTGTM